MIPFLPGPTLEAVGQTPATRAPVVSDGRSLLARTALATLLVLALALALAAQARADAFGDTFTDYKSHGSVEPCKFSEQTLKKATQQVPPDIVQYAPDFPAALQRALQARTAGACGGASGASATGGAPGVAGAPGGPSAGGGAAASSPGGTGATPAPPPIAVGTDHGIPQAAKLDRTSAANTPVPLIVIGILALLIGLPALAFYVARWRGWEPRWIPGMRYSMGEAGYRTGATFSEFADWLRLGR